MKIGSFSMEQSSVSKAYYEEHQSLQVEILKNIEAPKVENQNAVVMELNHLGDVDAPNQEDYLTEEDKKKIALIEDFITLLTGKKFKFKGFMKLDKAHAQEDLKHNKAAQVSGNNGNGNGNVNANGNSNAIDNSNGSGIGIRISTSHEIYEKEQMSFQSKGVIKTEDGCTIEFSLNAYYSREYYEKNQSTLQIGGVMQDPLVLNLDGKGVAFDGESMRLDLNLDGLEDVFRRLTSGSGFLAIDRNKNDQVDDGSELFGATTGQGFDELAVYDGDENGWIDENDAVFDELKIWSIDQKGAETLIGLKEAGVGAIYLKRVESPYHIKEGLNNIANITHSSIYLKESGEAAAIHEIDLKI